MTHFVGVGGETGRQAGHAVNTDLLVVGEKLFWICYLSWPVGTAAELPPQFAYAFLKLGCNCLGNALSVHFPGWSHISTSCLQTEACTAKLDTLAICSTFPGFTVCTTWLPGVVLQSLGCNQRPMSCCMHRQCCFSRLHLSHWLRHVYAMLPMRNLAAACTTQPVTCVAAWDLPKRWLRHVRAILPS